MHKKTDCALSAKTDSFTGSFQPGDSPDLQPENSPDFQSEDSTDLQSGNSPAAFLESAAQGDTLSGALSNQADSLPGGLGAVPGIRLSGVFAGFRRNPQRKDLALLVAPVGSRAAAVFTQNRFAAAPIKISREHLQAQIQAELPFDNQEAATAPSAAPLGAASAVATTSPVSGTVDTVGTPSSTNDTVAAAASVTPATFRALLINSGNANAATGEPGYRSAARSCQLLAETLGCSPQQVLVASTGVIGEPLGSEPFEKGIPLAWAQLGRDDGSDHAAALAAAEAIMTTDTRPKQAALSFRGIQSDGTEVSYRIGGMAKGSGMIQPDMATLIAVLATDAMLSREAAEEALTKACSLTFNRVTIDSDTSTNDSAFLIATGASAGKTIVPGCPLYEPFLQALIGVCERLAYQIVQDGEGATKVINVQVKDAATSEDALRAARAIANSPLVKTAVAGHDANWGRIVMALGKSGACFEQNRVCVAILGIEVCQDGLAVPFDEAAAQRAFATRDEVLIEVWLGAGRCAARVLSCDLTRGYIDINAHYRT
jgi:glutamate N-acetyltransferase/amino-acid N-acetyltransferase